MLTLAHRGAHACFPENTLDAFAEAVRLGMDGVELDVHLAAGGEVVVIHDETVNRTTNGKGRVAELDLRALKALRVGKAAKIPLLQEALEIIGTDRYCLIEIKHPSAAVPAAMIMQDFNAKGWNGEKLFLISFQHEALREAKAAVPKVHIGASFETLSDGSVLQATAMGATALLPHYKACTASHIAAAHHSGLRVFPWTVNSLRSMKRLQNAGVDGIISDHPECLKQAFG